MSEWKKVRLGDCCTYQYGYTASATNVNTGTKLLRITDIVPNYIDWNSVPYCQISDSEKKKYILHKGDIVIARTGATVGYAKYIKEDVMSVFASYLVRFTVNRNDVDSKYLGYCIDSSVFKGYISSISNGSAQPNANSQMMSSFEFLLPPLDTQKRIAEVLSSYDSLIENYQRQIKLLEEAAQRLYKEWFVDFRFPGHETTKFVNGIPEGWNITSVDNIIEKLESGSRPKGGIDTSIKEGIASVGAENVIGPGLYNFSSEKLVSYDFYKNAKKGKIENKDILIYKDGAYIGRTSLFQDNFPHKEAMVNEHVFLLHTKEEISQYFLFFTLYQKVYFEKMQKLNKNAAQPGLNQNAIKSLKLLMPNKKYIVKFDEVISPMMKKLFALANQIRSLTEARDRLLPKLMNGEIEV